MRMPRRVVANQITRPADGLQRICHDISHQFKTENRDPCLTINFIPSA
jgi:hypothetical protein